MGYGIELQDPVTKETIELYTAHEVRGSNYVDGGTTEASLNITYNYGEIFRKVMGKEGIRSIYGLSGAESVPVLQRAIDSLSDDVNPDYWTATEGNAKRALHGLLAFAQLRPDGIWAGD